MTDKIKSAFDEIKAEQELKTATKYFLYEKYNKPVKSASVQIRKAAAVSVCASFLILICSTFLVYTTPVSAISLDSDTSSVELEVNRFDKVIKVNCYGDSSKAEVLRLKNMNYKDAVSVVLDCTEEKASSTVLTVSCNSSGRCDEIVEQINHCQDDATAVSCHSESHRSLSAEAHSLGISTGKYNAYLQLRELGYEITIDEIKDLPMREIREIINSLSSTEGSVTDTSEHCTDSTDTTCQSTASHNGNGQQHHKNHKNNQG